VCLPYRSRRIARGHGERRTHREPRVTRALWRHLVEATHRHSLDASSRRRRLVGTVRRAAHSKGGPPNRGGLIDETVGVSALTGLCPCGPLERRW